METTTPTRTAKSHTQSRDHAHDRHDPVRDHTLARVRLLVHVPAQHRDRRVRNLGPPGRGHSRDRGLDRALRRPRTLRRTTTTKAAARGKAKRRAIDREPRPNRPARRSPNTTRAPARLRPTRHQSTKRAKRNTIAEETTGTAVITGTSTETIGNARPRMIGTGIAIVIVIATTRAATIGMTTGRTIAAAATGTATSGTSIAVVAVTDTATIGIDLQSTTGTETVGDKVVLLWSGGCFLSSCGNAILRGILRF